MSGENGKPQRLVLLDTNAFHFNSRKNDRVCDRLYEGVEGFESFTPEDVRDMIRHFETASSIENLVTIDEVVREIEEHLYIVNEQVGYWKSQLPGKGKKKGKKFRKGSRRQSFESGGNGVVIPRNLGDFEVYANHVHNLIHDLSRIGNARDRFDGYQWFSYNTALKIAGRNTKVNGECVKLGDKLETDNKLIATALALGIYNPVSLVSFDDGLVKNFDYVKDRMIFGAEALERQGRPFAKPPRHEVRIDDIDEFVEQSLLQ